jgi:RES domain-containing protein
MSAVRKADLPERARRSIQDRIARAAPWSGIAYRATTIEYANRGDIISGAGSRRHGGRWNPRGGFAAVYASLNARTALEESIAGYEEYGIPAARAMPLVLVALDLDLERTIDLTPRAFWESAGLVRAKVLRESWEDAQDQSLEAVSQCLGRLVFEGDVQGILVPSARVRRAQNVVVFPAKLGRTSVLRVRNVEKLPPAR